MQYRFVEPSVPIYFRQLRSIKSFQGVEIVQEELFEVFGLQSFAFELSNGNPKIRNSWR